MRLLSAAEWAWRQRGPTESAIRLFGARHDALRRLPGGEGHTWTDGRLVLKPVGCTAEHAWVCKVYAAWKSGEVRVPQPLQAQVDAEVRWSVEGWGAHVFVPGRDVDLVAELPLVREASNAFHEGIRNLPRPDFMDMRNDPWAYGDRLAWEGVEPEADDETLTLIGRLRAHLAPVDSPEQVIHGDILPNMLVADRLPPAVIDWPPYFRPVGTANAIAATDAVTFQDAPLTLLEEWATGEDWNQLLIRALLYRLGPTGLFAARSSLMGSLVTHFERAKPVVDAVLSR